MSKYIVAVVVLLLCAGLLCGCQESEGPNGEEPLSGGSFTSIAIGDKPTEDFDHVYVTFSEVLLHSNETDWVNISLDTMMVDLIYLHVQNLSEVIGVEELQAGNYTKLWIVVDNASGVLNSTGETVFFDVPSGTLKIQHLFDIREGNTTITVDIDLDNSIVELGHGGGYKLLPVIGALRVQHANGSLEQVRDRDRLKDKTGNRGPAVDLRANGTRGKPVSTCVNSSISFNASETIDIEGDTLTFSWDFGDNTTGTGMVVSHSYESNGSYWVTLTVSDGELESTASVHVVVKQCGQGDNGAGNGPA